MPTTRYTPNPPKALLLQHYSFNTMRFPMALPTRILLLSLVMGLLWHPRLAAQQPPAQATQNPVQLCKYLIQQLDTRPGSIDTTALAPLLAPGARLHMALCVIGADPCEVYNLGFNGFARLLNQNRTAYQRKAYYEPSGDIALTGYGLTRRVQVPCTGTTVNAQGQDKTQRAVWYFTLALAEDRWHITHLQIQPELPGEEGPWGK